MSNTDWLDETIGAAEASARRAKEREENHHAMAKELAVLCASLKGEGWLTRYADMLLARYESLYPKEER